MGTDECLFCAEERDIWAKYDCGHTGCCWKCALRIRFKGDKEKRELCLECQTASKKLLLFKDNEDRTADTVTEPVWGVECENEKVLMEVKYLRDMYCPKYEECGGYDVFRGWNELRRHVVEEHGVTFCQVCVEARPLFLSEQTLYTQKQLKKHESTTETCDLDESNFHGHPKCYFCNMLTYDTLALYNHMHQKHFLCEFCERTPDKKLIFHRSMYELVAHWRSDHYYCERCEVENQGRQDHHPSEWAFGNEIDFTAHEAKKHGAKPVLGIGIGVRSYADERQRGGYRGGSQPSVPLDEEPETGFSSEHVITFMMGRRVERVSMGMPKGVAGDDGQSQGKGKGRGRGRGRGDGRGGQQQQQQPREVERIPNEKERNMQLMAKIKKLCGGNVTKFNQFRLLSAEFLKGNMQSADYYEQLQIFFGKNMETIFSDLVDLLPDPNKKAGLRLVHNTATSKERGVPEPPVPSTAKPLNLTNKKQKQPQPQQPQATASSHWLDRTRGSSGVTTTQLGRSTTPPPSVPSASDFPALQTAPTGKKKKGAKPSPKPAAATSSSSGVWAQKAKQRK